MLTRILVKSLHAFYLPTGYIANTSRNPAAARNLVIPCRDAFGIHHPLETHEQLFQQGRFLTRPLPYGHRGIISESECFSNIGTTVEG